MVIALLWPMYPQPTMSFSGSKDGSARGCVRVGDKAWSCDNTIQLVSETEHCCYSRCRHDYNY